MLNRKFGVKAIAILFMSLGIMYLGMFFLPFFSSASDKGLNLTYLIYTSFLLQAGWWLFNLKETGRNLVIFLLSLRAIVNSTGIVWLLMQDKSEFSIVVNFLGKPFFNSESPFVFVSIISAWLFIVIAMMAFLLQKETRLMFSSDNEKSQPQAKVLTQ